MATSNYAEDRNYVLGNGNGEKDKIEISWLKVVTFIHNLLIGVTPPTRGSRMQRSFFHSNAESHLNP